MFRMYKDPLHNYNEKKNNSIKDEQNIWNTFIQGRYTSCENTCKYAQHG
jgi:hypothetical protein